MAKGARKLSDDEIGLVKAMLAKGMANDLIHFYFNRADRLISSGRIAQIKKNTYGASVPEKSEAELNAFLREWEVRQRAPAIIGSQAPTDDAVLRAMFSQGADGWLVTTGESDHVECKLRFRLAPAEHFADVIRLIAGLANNKGGYVFLGVRDATYAVEGLPDNAFAEVDPALINRTLASALDPVPRVVKAVVEIDGRTVGVLHVEKHEHGPVVATKNIGNEVKEGAIYFRYVGETRAIKPGELRQIIAAREQRAIAEFSRRMAQVGAGLQATIDLETGKVLGRTGQVLLDRELLEGLQFMREGEFNEVAGTPALSLVGEVVPVSQAERERVRIIRQTVTPDSVVRNFLAGEAVAEPLQYIQSQAHTQRRWLPVWYYARRAGQQAGAVAEILRSEVATNPASRDALVNRLLKKTSAYKVQGGRPAMRLVQIVRGDIDAPATPREEMEFASAVQGLPDNYEQADGLRPMLLALLNKAGGADSRSAQLRSAVYRAASRLDEILYRP